MTPPVDIGTAVRLVDVLAAERPASSAAGAATRDGADGPAVLPPASSATPAIRSLFLTCEQRAKTRYRARLSDGSDAVVVLPRGSVVRPGTRLVADSGEIVQVVAVAEQVYRVVAGAGSADPAFDLLRGAYHLGNRHVPVELGPGFLKLERDPVLRDLLQRLGLTVTNAFEPFDPEPGAYGGGHRHDTDVEGGTIGEALSQSAHAGTTSAAASESPE